QQSTGNLGFTEHEWLVDQIFKHKDTESHPTTARYMARKLWKFFAYDPVVDVGTSRVDVPIIDAVADAFSGISIANPNGTYLLADALRQMFLTAEFYADATRTVKGPVEYVVGSIRMLHGRMTGDTKANIGNDTIANQGQEVLNPPDVFSWRGNLRW